MFSLQIKSVTLLLDSYIYISIAYPILFIFYLAI